MTDALAEPTGKVSGWNHADPSQCIDPGMFFLSRHEHEFFQESEGCEAAASRLSRRDAGLRKYDTIASTMRCEVSLSTRPTNKGWKFSLSVPSPSRLREGRPIRAAGKGLFRNPLRG
jgi:hypothetical protein